MADTDEHNIHGSLLIKLKTTVEGLLAGQSAQGVWTKYGGLKRVCVDTEAILCHGIKNNQASSESEGGYWKFVQGLKWLCPSMAAIIDKLNKRRSQGLTFAQSGREWLQEAVQELSFVRQLDVLIGHKEHLYNFYHANAFLCQDQYVEAMRICFKAIELNKPALLSDINPLLLKPPKPQHQPTTSLPTSLPHRALRLGPSRLTPDGKTPLPTRQYQRCASSSTVDMGSKHSHVLEVNYPNLNGSNLSLTVDPSIGFGVSSTRPHKSLSEPQTIGRGLSLDEPEWSSDHTSMYTSCTTSSYETTAILPLDDDLESSGRLAEVVDKDNKRRSLASSSGYRSESGGSGSHQNLTFLTASSPDSVGLQVYDDINVESSAATLPAGDSKECKVIIPHKEDNSRLDSRLLSPDGDDDEYKQSMADEGEGGGSGKSVDEKKCEVDNESDISERTLVENAIDSECLSPLSSSCIETGISDNRESGDNSNSSGKDDNSSQDQCDSANPYDISRDIVKDNQTNNENAKLVANSDGQAAAATATHPEPSSADLEAHSSNNDNDDNDNIPQLPVSQSSCSSEIVSGKSPTAGSGVTPVNKKAAGLVKSFSLDVGALEGIHRSSSSSSLQSSSNSNNPLSVLNVNNSSNLFGDGQDTPTTIHGQMTTAHSSTSLNQQQQQQQQQQQREGNKDTKRGSVTSQTHIPGSDPLAFPPTPTSPSPHPPFPPKHETDEAEDSTPTPLSSSSHSASAIYIPPSFQNRGGSLERDLLPPTSDLQTRPQARHKPGHKRWVSDTSAIQVQRSSQNAIIHPPSSSTTSSSVAAAAPASGAASSGRNTPAAAAAAVNRPFGHPSYHGTLTRPQEGQSLISYLISQDFNTCANMEKENAHFHISEALIAAFESMQWNRTMKKDDSERTHSSSSASSSDEEIQELRQRIRIRKREKMMQRGRSFPSLSDDAQDGPGDDLTPPDTNTLQGSLSEDGEEQGELDLKLSTDVSGSESGATANLEDLASRGLNLSMASLYSEVEIQRSNQQAQQRSISQEEAILTAGSAESVAISLLKKFSEKHLPKASELKWLVSERDAPQRLLPLPASIPVSPDDAENQDLVQSTTQTRLRGNLEWAPPRAQIIFSVHPSEKRAVVLARQNYRCAGCGTRVDPAFAKRYRYCEYLGKYFCQCCHSAETYIIPGRVIERWDFTRYPISIFSLRLLEKMWREPLFHIDNVNPGLYKRVRGLEAIREGRQQLIHLHALLGVCKRDAKLLKEIQHLPSHWIESDNVYSMEDFILVKSGQMQSTIKSLVSAAKQHVADCQLCQGLGFICGLCKDTRVIFPFQLQTVVRCPVCQSCYHKTCFVSKECPKCLRLEARRKQQQEAVTPQSPDSDHEFDSQGEHSSDGSTPTPMDQKDGSDTDDTKGRSRTA